MPEMNRRCFNSTGTDRFRMHIVNYLCKRSLNGQENDSKHFTKKLFDSAKDLYKKDLTAHFGCVNAIEFSSDGNLLFSGGDDRRVLMWNVNDAMMYYTGKLGDGAKPFGMKRCHYSNIFCLAVDHENKRVLSGSNDDQVIVHDYATGNLVDVFLHDSPVFSLSLHPNNGNIFASAADNGRILIYDIRESNADLLCVAKLRTPFHGVMFNPCEPSLIATANSKLGVHLWDLRKPKEILIKCSDDASMAVRWNQSGNILLALRNLLPIVLYDPLVPKTKLEFDANTYFNACTMKSCSFAGDNDEYILSGSDDFNLYMWKIPEPWPESKWVGSEHLTLTGHRSIVNQVRYSPSKQLIATSGVEKIVKLWSPFPMPYSEGSPDKPTTNRHRVLCSSRSCPKSPDLPSHDYSQESVEEDTRMIHFFDYLLQNELDELTFLPLSPSYHIDANLFYVPNKRETKIYEKLIRKKKKRLSKILLEESDENKSVCSLSRSGSGNVGQSKAAPFPPPPPPPVPLRSIPLAAERPSSNGSEDESVASGSLELSRTQVTNSNAEASVDGGSSSSPASSRSNYSPSLCSSSTASNAASCANLSSDSHLSSEQLNSDCQSTSDRSKVSFSSRFFDSDDSNGTFDSRSINTLIKDSVGNFSETSDSEEIRPCEIFKRKRVGSSRCYRNLSRKRRKESSSDSSDSEHHEKKANAEEKEEVEEEEEEEEEEGGGGGGTGEGEEKEKEKETRSCGSKKQSASSSAKEAADGAVACSDSDNESSVDDNNDNIDCT